MGTFTGIVLVIGCVAFCAVAVIKLVQAIKDRKARNATNQEGESNTDEKGVE